MKHRFSGLKSVPRALGAIVALFVGMHTAARAATITLDVDASDIARNFVSSTMRIEAAPGPMELFFVIWSPGNHTPSGPIENVVDLKVTDCRGRPIHWDRDATRVERLMLTVPDGCTHITVNMGYIASQPNYNSRSTDTYGRPNLGLVNWNTMLLYPAGKTNQEITVEASLAIPSTWSLATPLPTRTVPDDRFNALQTLTPGKQVTWTSFAEVPLAELVDSPVIMGRYLKRYPLEVGEGIAPHGLTVVAPEEKYTIVPDWLLAKYTEMCRQTMTLFTFPGKPPFPRERFEFLIICEETMRMGIEHATSTLIAMPTKTFSDAKEDTEKLKGGGRDTTVIPHEYFHVWCGKMVAPEGLVSSDFHTPARTELLWVYEGLTTYYDNVLAARAGLLSEEEYKQEILNNTVALEQRTGRLWRSVEDTARAARFLRQRGLYWYDRRRGQEYYGEGAAFWMEVDALLRTKSQGAVTLDEFCASFFDRPVNPVGAQASFDRDDVLQALTKLQSGVDWDQLIKDRIEAPVSQLDMNPLLTQLGWKLEYAEEPTPEQKKMGAYDESAAEVNLRTSLGLRLSKDAEVIDIVPGAPADEAGLAYGMKVIAVDGWLYSPARLRASVKETPSTGAVEFTISFGDRVETKKVTYNQGPRVPRLVRIEGAPDVLTETIRPR